MFRDLRDSDHFRPIHVPQKAFIPCIVLVIPLDIQKTSLKMDTAKPVNFDEAVVSPQPVGVTETHWVTYVPGCHGMDLFLSIEKQLT